MGENLSTKEGHKGRRKRSETLIKGEQRWLTTHHISNEHGDKINHLIGAEAWTCKTNVLFDVLQQT